MVRVRVRVRVRANPNPNPSPNPNPNLLAHGRMVAARAKASGVRPCASVTLTSART